jgi:hypothetical protein
MKRTLLICITLLFICCMQMYAFRPRKYRISIDRAVITVNGKTLALPTTMAELEKVFGKPSRVVSKGSTESIPVWDNIGIYCYEFKSANRGRVPDLVIALDRSDINLDFYPKRYFGGLLSVDKIAITKDSTVVSVNNRREEEKFIDLSHYGVYWSVKYGGKTVGLSTNKQQRIYAVDIGSDGSPGGTIISDKGTLTK